MNSKERSEPSHMEVVVERKDKKKNNEYVGEHVCVKQKAKKKKNRLQRTQEKFFFSIK